MTISTRITPILGTFFLASTEEQVKGESWYGLAHSDAVQIACQTRVTIPTACGVIAALSPNNNWKRNLIDAYNLIRSFVDHGRYDAEKVRVCTFNKNKLKALDILDGFARPLDILGGLKVRSFYNLIYDPLADDVCIDGHAYSIWAGERVTTTKTPKIGVGLYASIQQDYRLAAMKVSEIQGQTITASQLQAVTWIVHRDLYKGQRRKTRKAVSAK